jgi:peptide-methionine (S)-S-oxide reductase
MTPDESMEVATFAAGCFWGVEDAFSKVPGVYATRVGYTGGRAEHPTYRDVCSGTTGHAEAVRVVFDPGTISYADLLDVFWNIHDPTTPGRQGVDVGEQYRSAIFHHSPEQERLAEESRAALAASGRFRRPIVTEIVPAGRFWDAEEYHQQYFAKNGGGGCHISYRPAPGQRSGGGK